jgi:hypothetical protein
VSDYFTELDRRIDAHNELVKVREWCERHRKEVLAMPLPRNECPGCFITIYDLAAKDGWCTNCNPDNRTSTTVSRG